MISWGQIKLYALIGLIFVTFTLGVKVTRDHYKAKEAAAKIEELETAITIRDRLSELLNTHLRTQEALTTQANERIKKYEEYLRSRNDICTLDSDDIRWMQPLRRPRSAPAR